MQSRNNRNAKALLADAIPAAQLAALDDAALDEALRHEVRAMIAHARAVRTAAGL
jgi:hypothetical protein